MEILEWNRTSGVVLAACVRSRRFVMLVYRTLSTYLLARVCVEACLLEAVQRHSAGPAGGGYQGPPRLLVT